MSMSPSLSQQINCKSRHESPRIHIGVNANMAVVNICASVEREHISHERILLPQNFNLRVMFGNDDRVKSRTRG